VGQRGLGFVQAESENVCPGGASHGVPYAQQAPPTSTYVMTAAHRSVVCFGGGHAGAAESAPLARGAGDRAASLGVSLALAGPGPDGEADAGARLDGDGGLASQPTKRRQHSDRADPAPENRAIGPETETRRVWQQ
jgi:hypothetical protein